MGAVPFSPTLSGKIHEISLWKQVIKKLRGAKHSTRDIVRLARKANIVVPEDIQIDIALKNLKTAYKEYYQNLKKSAKIKISISDGQSVNSEASGNMALANHYRQLLEHERSRELNSRISFMFQTGRAKLDSIEGVDRRGANILADTKIAMEEVAEVENISRFTQSNDMPFLQEPLLGELGTLAELPAAEHILEGRYIPAQGTNEATKELIKNFAYPKGQVPSTIVE